MLSFQLRVNVSIGKYRRAGVAEWFRAVLTAQTVVGSSPIPNLHQCLWTRLGHIWKYVDWKGSAAILTSVQSEGVTPEVNLRITQARKHTKRDPPWLCNPGQTLPEIQNRQGYQWSHEKDSWLPKIYFIKKRIGKYAFSFIKIKPCQMFDFSWNYLPFFSNCPFLMWHVSVRLTRIRRLSSIFQQTMI